MKVQKTEFTLPREKANVFETFAEESGIALDIGKSDPNTDAQTHLKFTWFAADDLEQRILETRLPVLAEEAGETLSPLTWEDVVEENWQAKALEDFPPIEIGQFVITRNEEDIAEDKIRLRIPAAMAFGSGEHATTEGCLQLFQDLFEDGEDAPEGFTCLDMGAGSGVLAIAAAIRNKIPGLCVDIHDISVEVCAENTVDNGVESFVTSIMGDGFNTAEVQSQQPFNLTFANILAKPLISMSGQLVDTLAENGIAIISGFLTEQRDEVEKAYTDKGMKTVAEFTNNGWVALALKK